MGSSQNLPEKQHGLTHTDALRHCSELIDE
jgi:hypothetical protein